MVCTHTHVRFEKQKNANRKLMIGMSCILIAMSSLVFTVLCMSIWVFRKFGDFEIEKILFSLYVPLKNESTDWMKLIWVPLLASLCFFCVLIVLRKFILKHPKTTVCFFFVLLVGTSGYIEKHFSVWDYIKSYTASNFIKKNYVDPGKVSLSFPKRKKNLIFIQVESLESSVQDKNNGGFFNINYIPHLTKIAKENVSFSHSTLIEGATVLPSTGWTIAAMVAETTGLPLKLYAKDHLHVDNSMGNYLTFLPGAISLGDILAQNGYKNVFILGTNRKSSGQEDYLTQHGHYEIYDRNNINGNGKNR